MVRRRVLAVAAWPLRLAPLIALLPAAAVATSLSQSTTAELEEAIRARGLDPAQIILPATVNEEMRLWLRERVPEEGEPRRRLRELLAALIDPDDLGIRYESDAHGTAQEVFERRSANCLAFTNLFVAMARDLGLDAYYLEVRRQPRYQHEGDLVVVWEHVTAGYGSAADRLALEFSLGPPLESTVSRRLSDLTALAMYYSNRGAQMLRQGANREALPWLETAARLDPGWYHAWLNLGVARRRTGDLQGAEAAYRAAVEADPSHLQAYHNLAALLRLRGDKSAAGELLRLLDRRDNRDPYLHLALGDSSLEDGRLREARRFYRRALRLSPEGPEPSAALGLLALAEGRPRRARRWLDRARRWDQQTDRVERLRMGLEEADSLQSPRKGANE